MYTGIPNPSLGTDVGFSNFVYLVMKLQSWQFGGLLQPQNVKKIHYVKINHKRKKINHKCKNISLICKNHPQL